MEKCLAAKELAEMLEEGLKNTEYDYSIRTMSLPKWVLKLGGIFGDDPNDTFYYFDAP